MSGDERLELQAAISRRAAEIAPYAGNDAAWDAQLDQAAREIAPQWSYGIYKAIGETRAKVILHRKVVP